MTDDVFDDKATEVEEKEEAEAPEKPDDAEETEGEESKGEEVSESPAEENTGQTVPLAALQSERSKRQELERKLAEKTAVDAPDKATDPEGYDRFMRIELSRDLMRETHDDYDEVISHYQEMVKANPEIDAITGDKRNPAKFAYDLAKKDLEIAELDTLSKSDDWKEFQKWKKDQAKEQKANLKPDVKAVLSVPNLNKATSLKKAAPKSDDDDVFAGAAF